MRTRALAAGLAMLIGVALPVASAPGVACASEAYPTAALVVDNGKRVLTMCVALDDESVSGLHLIELAGAQHGLSYGFGMGGLAVCRLDGVGPAGDDCFADYPEYWGYWHGDGKGGWAWASTGAGGYQVSDGDVEGWVWGEGDTGQSHEAPPPLAHDDVCEENEPTPSSKPTATPKPTQTPAPSQAPSPSARPTTAASSPAATPEPSGSKSPKGDRSATPASPTAGADQQVGGPADGQAGGQVGESASAGAPGPPPAGAGPILALGLALALVAGGWLRMRSRAMGGAP